MNGGTSDDGIGALDDVVRFFIEVEVVGSDSGMDAGLIEVTIDHGEERLALILERGEHEGLGVPGGQAGSDISYHWELIDWFWIFYKF